MFHLSDYHPRLIKTSSGEVGWGLPSPQLHIIKEVMVGSFFKVLGPMEHISFKNKSKGHN